MAAEPKQAMAPPAATASRVEDEGPFSKGWYWSTLSIAALSLFIIWLYYGSGLALWIQALYWISAILGIIILVWSLGALLRRYHVGARIGGSARRMAARRRATESEAAEEEVVYRENIVVRLFREIGHWIQLFFLFLWNTFLRILYIIEFTVLYSLILGYDVIYYVLYAAWSLTYYAVRLAWRITYWALRVSWRILRILTKFPIARTIWRKKMRPAILASWDRRVTLYKERHAHRRDQRRRLAAAKGHDPDQWEKDQRLRHHFPLPHPHEARRGLRARIERRRTHDLARRARWRAIRKGTAAPPTLKKTEKEKEARRSQREAARRAREQRKKLERESRRKVQKKGKAASAAARPSPSDERRIV